MKKSEFKNKKERFKKKKKNNKKKRNGNTLLKGKEETWKTNNRMQKKAKNNVNPLFKGIGCLMVKKKRFLKAKNEKKNEWRVERPRKTRG